METLFGKGRYIFLLLLLAIALIIPFEVDNSIRSLLIFTGLYALVALGLVLLMGYAGQISLGQAAFYGIGAYSTAILTTHFGINPWLSMLVGVVVSVIIAFGVGWPLLKLEHHYLALATLAFGMIVNVFINQSDFTGGTSGISGIPNLSIGPLVFNNDLKFYFLILFFVVVGSILAANIVDSRVGRSLRAVHTSEVAARSLAVPVHKIKTQVFALSAAYASIAGSLLASYMTFISPTDFTFHYSVNFLVIAVIGGLTSISGPILGALAFMFIQRGLKSFIPFLFPNVVGEYEIVVFGTLVVAIMILLPKGLSYGFWSIGQKLKAFLVKRRQAMGTVKCKEGEV